MVFVSFRTGSENIFVMDANTNAQATQVTFGGSDENPAWLAPCQSIVFDSFRGGNPQIYSVNLNGAGLQLLTTNHNFANTGPAPTPDGARIVFVSSRTGSNALWIMNADGSNQQPLGTLPGVASQPCVSPDGGSVAMVVNINGATEIGVVGLDGTGFIRLTSDGKQATHPTWLPDGSQIIFSSNRGPGGNTGLYSVGRSGANIQALPTNPSFALTPTVGGP